MELHIPIYALPNLLLPCEIIVVIFDLKSTITEISIELISEIDVDVD